MISNPSESPSWLSIEWMCADLGISRSTFDKWRKRGKGPRMKRFPNRDLMCRRDWYASWTEQLPDDDYWAGDDAAAGHAA